MSEFRDVRAGEGNRLARIGSRGAVAILAAVIAGCSPAPSAAPGASGPNAASGAPATSGATPAAPQTTLTIANAVNMDSLDPALEVHNETIWIDSVIYEGLTKTNEASTEIQPALAESWDVSPDGLTYTFHLRDAKFADGTPVTAEDARYSIARASGKDSAWGFLLTAVKDIQATDAKTLVMTLSGKHAPLLADLSMYAFAVLPKAQVEAQGDNFFKKPIGTGPFQVDSSEEGASLTLKVNPNWWGTKPNLTEIKYLIVPNDNDRTLLLQAKQVDVIENIPASYFDQVSADPQLQLNLFPSSRIDFITLNNNDPHLADKNVRNAINYGIDRNAIIQAAYAGKAIPAGSFFPYKMLYFDDSLQAPEFSIDKAKGLLAQSPYASGFKIELLEVANDVAGNATAVVVKDSLAKIGIDVDIKTNELTAAYSSMNNGDYQMGQRYYTNDIIDPDEVATDMDPDIFLHAFHSNWKNPDMHALLDAARAELDPTHRGELYKQVQKIVYDEAPLIFLDYGQFRYASGKWVNGFNVTQLGTYTDSLVRLTVTSH
jgi:peptide/nickel transport system substrate-binding protein